MLSPARPREDMDETEPLRLTGFGDCEVRVPEEDECGACIFRGPVGPGDRLLVEGVRAPDPPDLKDCMSTSLVVCRERASPLWTDALSTDGLRGMGGRRCGRLGRRVRVLSSRPLKASRSRLPSASTSSIWCLMSFADCTSSSLGSDSPGNGLAGSKIGGAPWNAEGGADEPDRFLPREVRAGLPGSDCVIMGLSCVVRVRSSPLLNDDSLARDASVRGVVCARSA